MKGGMPYLTLLSRLVITVDLLGDGQLEQLELLESSDTISVRSYEVSLSPPNPLCRLYVCVCVSLL